MDSIETDRLILREFKKQDALDIFEFLSDKNCCYMDGGYEPETDINSRSYKKLMKRMAKQNDERYMIQLKGENKCIGMLRMIEDRQRRVPAIEIGYGILPSYQNRGYATEAIKAIIDIAFNYAGIGLIVTKIIPQNLPSIRVMEKLGFVREGIIHKAAKYPPIGIVDYISFYLEKEDI